MPSPQAERAALGTTPASQPPPHKISEIAVLWNVSYDTVRRLFLNEPGVLHIGEGSRLLNGRHKKYKRGYVVLRVPHQVFLRVQDRLMHKRGPDTAVLAPPEPERMHVS